MDSATQAVTPGENRRGSGRGSEKGVRRFVARRSSIHGKGVFANVAMAAGTRLMEYKGERITDQQSEELYSDNTTHTFLFMLEDTMVIDGGRNGNTARWINHSCEPNCQAEEINGRVFIKALRDILPGEELFYDYGLVIDERMTAKVKKQYACHCGSPDCRGTMLSARR